MYRESDRKDRDSRTNYYNSNKSKKYSSNFGKYGLINLSDSFTRKLEFQAWLGEVKKKSNNENLNRNNSMNTQSNDKQNISTLNLKNTQQLNFTGQGETGNLFNQSSNI